MTDGGGGDSDELRRFSSQAREIIQKAESEARQLGHNWVGTEHLLLALFSRELTYDTFLRLGLEKAQILAAINRNRRFESTVSNDDYSHTVELKQALDTAIEEAGRADQNDVTHMHLLLGLFAEPRGGIITLLGELRLTAPMVYERIQISIKKGFTLPEFSGMTRWVLKFAEEEARNRRCVYIDSDHLLLGLVREQKGVGGKVLRELGVNYDTLTPHLLSPNDSPHPSKPLASKLTAEVRNILHAAVREASRPTSHFSYGEGMNTGHLLLGVVRQKSYLFDLLHLSNSAAIKLLKRAGFNPDMVREEARRALQDQMKK